MTHQFTDFRHEIGLGLIDSFLFPDNGNQFLVLILTRWENNTHAGLFTDLANVYTTTTDEETMVLRFGCYFSSEAVL